MPAGLEPVYTPAQLAEWLSVDRSTVTRWFANRPGVLRLGGEKASTLRIPKVVLDAFLDERRIGGVE